MMIDGRTTWTGWLQPISRPAAACPYIPTRSPLNYEYVGFWKIFQRK